MYPRALTPWEEEILSWLLPDEPYRAMRKFVLSASVIGTGRWGEHDLVLAKSPGEIDKSAPMMPVVASGEIECDEGVIAVSVHEKSVDGQVEIEITKSFVGDALHERRRWCYSYWKPGDPAPKSNTSVREIAFESGRIVIAPADKVLWLYDQKEQMTRLIPVTNFYNQLMLGRKERNPGVALDHKRLFTHTDEFSDKEILHGFAQYNRTWRKIDPSRISEPPEEKKYSWWGKIFQKKF